jgi:uncharacterized protein with ACT and thioredoxin-like domain
MKRIEIRLQDEAGQVISVQAWPLEVGSGRFEEIEQAVEALRREMLPKLEADLFGHEQAQFVQTLKKTRPIA